MINAIVEFLRADPGTRVAIAVPTHALGKGLSTRINAKFGTEVAAEWHGIGYPDPQAPDAKMCRLADAATELLSVGGKLQFLCSSRGHGHCPHHPLVAGSQACGYLRQQLPAIRNTVRVWIVPSVMLATTPPLALQRQGAITDFDLLVIDEAPWFNLLGGLDAEPDGALVEWLSPGWWEDQTPRAHQRDKSLAIDTLAKIHGVLSGHRLGEIPADAFRKAEVHSQAIMRARRFVFRCKADLRQLIRPGSLRRELGRRILRHRNNQSANLGGC